RRYLARSLPPRSVETHAVPHVNNSRAIALLFFAVAAPLVAFIYAWRLAPPILSTDSGTGFLVWESMLAGGPWNSRIMPAPADITSDQSRLITWWSPGQYVFPGSIRMLGFTWCHA